MNFVFEFFPLAGVRRDAPGSDPQGESRIAAGENEFAGKPPVRRQKFPAVRLDYICLFWLRPR